MTGLAVGMGRCALLRSPGIQLMGAPRGVRGGRRAARPLLLPASASGFLELRQTADSDFRRVRDLLPTLETAMQTAGKARAPADDAEAAWQESHRRLGALSEEVQGSMARLRSDVVEAAGGEAWATAQLVRHHLAARMERVRSQLEPTEWEEFEDVEIKVPIQGTQLLTKVAACVVGDRPWAVVGFALRGPFLSSGLHSLLLHWAVSQTNGGKWEQPPQGWHAEPAISHAKGDRAWQTQFGTFSPILEEKPVEEAVVHSIVLHLPLEGPLEAAAGCMPFVLKRTDGGQPEWVKRDHQHDFMLDLSKAIAHFAKKKADAATTALASPQDWFSEWGLDDWDWGRSLSGIAQRGAKQEEGWLGYVSSWEEQQGYLHPTAGLPSQLEHLRQLCKALASYGAGQMPEGHKGKALDGRALLQQCYDLERTLISLEGAELAAEAARKRREQLSEVLHQAEATVDALRQDVSGSLDAARRAVVRLRGRNTEVTQRDLEILAAQLAEGMRKQEETAEQQQQRTNGGDAPRGRQLVFLQQSVMRMSHVDAQVLVQTYLEGPKPAPLPTLPADAAQQHAAPAPSATANGAATNGTAAAGTTAAGSNGAAAKQPAPTFDSVLVSVAVGEDFPDGRFKAPLMLHWAAVPHEGGAWLSPPEGWVTSSPGTSLREGTATQTPLQRHTITLDSGAPLLVDPCLYAACMRLPLAGCKATGAQGLEFVLKGKDGVWLTRQQPHGRTSNFFMDLPRVA